MTLNTAQIIHLDDGRHAWSADLTDPTLNRDGVCRTFGEAQECVAQAVEAAAVSELWVGELELELRT